MHVNEMEIIPVAHREPPLRNSWGAHSEVAARTIVRLTTADGEVGIGETYGDKQVIAGLESARSHVEGMNPYEYRRLRYNVGDDMVYGAIETALLDLIGRIVGEPVYNLLGGKMRESVDFSAYLFYKYADSDFESAAIAPQEVMSPEAMVEEAREFVDSHGFETLKLKGGVLEPDQEIATLQQLAEEFGRDTPMRIDPNGAWTVGTATRIARELRERDLRIEFLEDPVVSMNAHARLKRNIDYPIATNMYVTEFDHIAPAVNTEAVDIILSDHHYWGGLTGNLRLDHTARTFDLGVGMHSNSHLGVSMAAMAHIGAAMPTVRYACDSHYPWMAEDVIKSPIEFEDGAIAPSDEPGLGIELDEDALQQMHERYQEEDVLAYSSVDSMAAEYADAMADRTDWLPNKPIW